MIKTKVIKKDNTIQEWDSSKIINAIIKASNRCTKSKITTKELEDVLLLVEKRLKDTEFISVLSLHEVVMSSLFQVNHDVYTEYRAYRNYKEKFTKSFANTYEFANKVVSIGDTENSNKDSQLNSTKQALIASGIMRELEMNFELRPEWVKAHNEGYIHIHDLAERFLRSQNCCLFNMKNVLKNGFELNGIKYLEPGGVQKAFDIASDVVLSASAQQYGGFTVSYIDNIMSYYAEKTYHKAIDYFKSKGITDLELLYDLAESQTIREIEQGVQAFETKLNTVSNSLGQTPFVTISFGLDTSKWGREVTRAILETRIRGLGKNNTTAVFPKLIFLHINEINGKENSPNYDLKQLAIKCSSTRLYPDWLSGDYGYQKEVYNECGRMVSPMGK